MLFPTPSIEVKTGTQANQNQMMQNDNKVPLVVRTVDDIADGRNNAKRV
jgi:hypothetical protein